MATDVENAVTRGSRNLWALQGIRIAAQCASLAIMARVLAPADFGVVATVTSVFALFDALKDFCLEETNVQAEDMTPETLAALHGANRAVGALLFASCVIAAPLLAWAYGDRRFLGLAPALGAAFPLAALSVQRQAMARRRLRIVACGMVDTASFVLGSLAGITAALAGASLWALVVTPLATHAFRYAGFAWLSPLGPLPRAPRASVLRALHGGATLSGAKLLALAALSWDACAVGWRYGPAELGFYERAHKLQELPYTLFVVPVYYLAVASLSRLAREPAQARAAMARLIGPLMAFYAPMIGVIWGGAEWWIPWLLGSAWKPMIPVFLAMGPFALLKPVTTLHLAALIAHARNRKAMIAAGLSLAFMIAWGGVSLWRGMGGVGMAHARSLSEGALALAFFAFLPDAGSLRFPRLIAASVIPWAVAAAAFGAMRAAMPLVAAALTGDTGHGPNLGWGTTVALVFFLGTVLFWGHRLIRGTMAGKRELFAISPSLRRSPGSAERGDRAGALSWPRLTRSPRHRERSSP